MERFISRQSRHFSFDVSFKKVLFHIFTLTWRVNNYVFRQGKGKNRRNENTKGLILCTDDINSSPFCFPTTFDLTSFQINRSKNYFSLHYFYLFFR